METPQKLIISYHLLLLAFILVISGCDKVEEPLPVFYSVEVAGDYAMATEEWLFATDSEGNVLDVKPVGGVNITIQLNGSVGSLTTFTLHHIIMSFSAGNPFVGVTGRSYTDVPVGGTWHLQPTPFDFLPFSTAWVEIVDFEGVPVTTRVSSARGDQTILGTDVPGSTTEIQFAVRGSEDFVVSSLYNNAFYYGILHNVTQLSHNTITLKPIDQPLTIDLTEANLIQLELAGYHDGDDLRHRGYISSEINQFQSAQGITLGYINGFDTYRTLISYYETGVYKTYEKRGIPLTQMPDFEDPTLTISSDKLTSLIGSVSIPYHYATLQFFANSPQHFLGWTVFRNGDNKTSVDFKLPALPEVISSRFPVIKLEYATFGNGFFVQYKDDYRYADKLIELSDTNIPPKVSTEYFSYTILR